MKLVFTKKAQQDLDNIPLHIAVDDVDTGLLLVMEIERRARILRRRLSPPPRPRSGLCLRVERR